MPLTLSVTKSLPTIEVPEARAGVSLSRHLPAFGFLGASRVSVS